MIYNTNYYHKNTYPSFNENKTAAESLSSKITSICKHFLLPVSFLMGQVPLVSWVGDQLEEAGVDVCSYFPDYILNTRCTLKDILGRPLLNRLQPSTLGVWAGLPVMGFIAPTYEEIFNRGIFQELLLKRMPAKLLEWSVSKKSSECWKNHTIPKIIRVALSSSLFAIHHIDVQRTIGNDVLCTIPLGILLGALVEQKGAQGLLHAISLHMLHNCLSYLVAANFLSNERITM